MDIKRQKNALRSLYREKRREVSPEERKRLDDRICRAVIASASFRYCEHLLLYCPIGEEVDVLPLAELALSQGKKVYFPRCEDGGRMTFFRVDSLSLLTPASFGIPEPPVGEAFPYESTAALCLVPGMVFGEDGNRIGYGRGYYDRFLRGFRGTSAGVVYSRFILPAVPGGRFDVPVNVLVSERGVKPTRENR